MSRVPIGPGTRVMLSFSLKLENGDLVDATNKPAVFEVGDGQLLPGFETAMFGLKAGEAHEFTLEPDQGFGAVNPENVHRLKQSDFSDIDLSEGLVVSFADGEGHERPGVVTALYGDVVEVDFNHPLAGKTLRFAVEIHDVKQISNEIARG